MDLPFHPLHPQSNSIPLSDWLSLLTLCLAPIIAHIAAGVPRPTYLTRSRLPKWHDHIAHYNPASIIWRYAAITDRRIRTPSWGPSDMAAANAVFWTERGWDGSEEITTRGDLYATHVPDRGYTSIFSWEFLKTAVVTLQGVQVVYLFAGGFVGQVKLPSFAVDTISFPIAILGLLRLWPAFWVTDDFGYAVGGEKSTSGGGGVLVGDAEDVLNLPKEAVAILGDWDMGFRSREDVRRLLDSPTRPSHSRFRPSSYWPSRVFRVLYAMPLVTMWPFALLTLLPGPWHRTGKLSMTAYLGAFLSTINLLTMTIIYGYYAARHGCRSTIIPCISAAWYKTLTVLFWAAALGLIVISAVETRRTPCGKYTTAGEHMDGYYCPGLVSLGVGENTFGMAKWANGTNSSSMVERREFEVMEFSGTCQGAISQSRGFYNVSA